MVKILTKNGVDNTNIDGARSYHFLTGGLSGVVKGVLQEFKPTLSSPAVNIAPGELYIAGHRILSDNIIRLTLSSQSQFDVRWSVVASLTVRNGDPTFEVILMQTGSVLIQDDLYAKSSGEGVYQLELCQFTQFGVILRDLRVTAPVLSGAFGLSPELPEWVVISPDKPPSQETTTEELGSYSIQAGLGTQSPNDNQTSLGRYNSPGENTLFEIGNGSGPDNRSTAFSVREDGTAVAQNAVEILSEQKNSPSALTKKSYVDTQLLSKVDTAEFERLRQSVSDLTQSQVFQMNMSGVARQIQTPGALPHGILKTIGASSSYPNGRMQTYIYEKYTILDTDKSSVQITDSLVPRLPLEIKSNIDSYEGNYQIKFLWGEDLEAVFPAQETTVIPDLGEHYTNGTPVSVYIEMNGGSWITISRVQIDTFFNGGVTKVTVGYPWLANSASITDAEPSETIFIDNNTFRYPKGVKNPITIPCSVPIGETVRTVLTSTPSPEVDTDRIDRSVLLGANRQNVSDLTSLKPITATAPGQYVALYKNSATVKSSQIFYIRDMEVLFADPEKATIMKQISNITIPDAILNIDGYGLGIDEVHYNYLDLVNRQFIRSCTMDSDGFVKLLPETEYIDVSTVISEDFSDILLGAGAIVNFHTAKGESSKVPYSLSYLRR